MAQEFEGDTIRPSTLYVQPHKQKALGETYHWAFVLTDGEGEGATLHHCTDRSGEWVHEVAPLSQVVPTTNTVCMVGPGQIPEEKRAEAERIMDEVAIMPVGSKVASGELFNCRTWLKMAIHQLDRACVIKLISDVDYLETSLRMLAGQIVTQRSQGRSSKKVAARVYDRA